MSQKSSIRYYVGEFCTRAKNFIRHPVTQIFIGVCIGLSAIAEIAQSIEENRHYLGGHHGLLLFGIGQIFVALGDLREALQQSAEALEKSQLLEQMAQIEEKVVAEAMRIEQNVIDFGQSLVGDEPGANGGASRANETAAPIAVAGSVVERVSTETAGSTGVLSQQLDPVSPPEPFVVQVPAEVAPVAITSPVVATVSTETLGLAEVAASPVAEMSRPVAKELPPPLDLVWPLEPDVVQAPEEVTPDAVAGSDAEIVSTEAAESDEELPPPLNFALSPEPAAVQSPVEVVAAVDPGPVSLPFAAEVPSPAPAAWLAPVPGPRPIAIQQGRVVLNFPGLFDEGPNGFEVLVSRLLAVPGVERVETDGDAVTMHLIGGATPGPGLLKATAAALRETRTGAPALPN